MAKSATMKDGEERDDDVHQPLGGQAVGGKRQAKAVQGGKYRLHGRIGIILNAHF